MSIPQAQEFLKELVDHPKENRLPVLKERLNNLSIDLSDALIILNEAYLEKRHILKRQQQFVPAYLLNLWRRTENYKSLDHWEDALIPLFADFILEHKDLTTK